MNEDEQLQFKLDKQRDKVNDTKHEELMTSDYDYAVDSLDLHQTIHDGLAKLNDCGWNVSFDELLDYLKEV